MHLPFFARKPKRQSRFVRQSDLASDQFGLFKQTWIRISSYDTQVKITPLPVMESKLQDDINT